MKIYEIVEKVKAKYSIDESKDEGYYVQSLIDYFEQDRITYTHFVKELHCYYQELEEKQWREMEYWEDM